MKALSLILILSIVGCGKGEATEPVFSSRAPFAYISDTKLLCDSLKLYRTSDTPIMSTGLNIIAFDQSGVFLLHRLVETSVNDAEAVGEKLDTTTIYFNYCTVSVVGGFVNSVHDIVAPKICGNGWGQTPCPIAPHTCQSNLPPFCHH